MMKVESRAAAVMRRTKISDACADQLPHTHLAIGVQVPCAIADDRIPYWAVLTAEFAVGAFPGQFTKLHESLAYP